MNTESDLQGTSRISSKMSMMSQLNRFKTLGNKGLGGAKNGYNTLQELFDEQMNVARQTPVHYDSERIKPFLDTDLF